MVNTSVMNAADEMRRQKARNLRYKKAALHRLNLEEIQRDMYDIAEYCSDIHYYLSSEEGSLLDALDGDEEEEYEFCMMFADIEGDCETLLSALDGEYVTEYFDDFLVGIAGNRYKAIGYDSYEEDYYSLCGYEANIAQEESGKRLQRLTKSELIATAGQVFGIVTAYLNISQKHDYLKSTLEILKSENTSYLQLIRQIDEAYSEAERDDFYYSNESTKKLDGLIRQMPDRAWLE